MQLFDPNDVLSGNPQSNIAIAFIYSWNKDKPPKEIEQFFTRVSNYAALTGYWRTTNGARYVLSNILANPNINKLVCIVFGAVDNGHLLVDALRNFYKNGVDKNGVIIGSKAPNPKFEQVPAEALKRFKKQADLVIMKNVDIDMLDAIEEVIKACYQESENAMDTANIPQDFFEMYSVLGSKNLLYDDGARFDKPYVVDLLSSSSKPKWKKESESDSRLGQSLYADNLEDAMNIISHHVYYKGSAHTDQRGITTFESRSLTMTINDALKKIPSGFCKEYLKKYVDEFVYGKGEMLDDFKYTYHSRIFKKWGNQPEKIVELLKSNPETRRAIICLWSPMEDLETESPPCLDIIGCFIRDGKLEFHVLYRSHHLTTVTMDGDIMAGEGALVPNLYAIATLQEIMAKNIGVERGALSLTDFSGHLYTNAVK